MKLIADKKERVEYLRHVNDQVAAIDNSSKEIRERKFKQQKANSVEVKINPAMMGQDIKIDNPGKGY